MKMLVLVAAVVLAAGVGAAQQSATGDEAAVRKLSEDFSAALNKGDGKAAAALFTADGDYVSSTGRVARGPAEVEKLVNDQAAAAFKGMTFKVTMTSVRFVQPTVAISSGTFEASGPTARKGMTTAVAVKQGDKWQIAAIRAMVPAPMGAKPGSD